MTILLTAPWFEDLLERSSIFHTDGDIVDFAPADDFYWGEVERRILRAALEVATTEDWLAATEFLAEHQPFLRAYISDSRRSDFSVLLPLRAGDVVWDVGCGYGAISLGLARQGCRVLASDPTRERAAFTALRARQEGHAAHIQVIHSRSIEETPVRADTLEGVLLSGVLEYVGETGSASTPRAAQVSALRFLRQRLRPGGWLYLAIENRWGYQYLLGHKDHGGLWGTNLLPRRGADLLTSLYFKRAYRTWTYSHAGTIKLLRDAGFQRVSSFLLYPSYRAFKLVIPCQARRAFANGLLTASRTPKGVREIAGLIARHIPGTWRFLRFLAPEFAYVATA